MCDGCGSVIANPKHAKDCVINQIAEAVGLYHAIMWIHDLQLANMDFEVDSKRVANYFKRDSGDITSSKPFDQ
jgi:ribonuclease HI